MFNTLNEELQLSMFSTDILILTNDELVSLVIHLLKAYIHFRLDQDTNEYSSSKLKVAKLYSH